MEDNTEVQLIPSMRITITLPATDVNGGWAGVAADVMEITEFLDQHTFNFDIDIVGM